MSQLRIFSCLPNPRLWNATIPARLCGVDVEVRGASPVAPSCNFERLRRHPAFAPDVEAYLQKIERAPGGSHGR